MLPKEMFYLGDFLGPRSEMLLLLGCGVRSLKKCFI